MKNPWTDILEWWDEEHWLTNNIYEEFLTAKLSFPAAIHRATLWGRQQNLTVDIAKFAIDAINELFPERTKHPNGVGIFWSFNNHAATTFKDIQTVLIHCAEAWRQEFGTTT